MKKRVLVTGATGFVGGHLVQGLLDDGCHVSALLRAGSSEIYIDARAEILTHDGSTGRLDELVRRAAPDQAIHLASRFVAAHTPSDIDSLIESNLRFGCQLLDALARGGVGTLINFGTAWQHYETNAYRPVSLYAATKQAFESLAAYYVDACGLRMITLKLTDTYGPADRRGKLISALLCAAASGRPLALSPGDQVLDLVHVADVVEAVRVALARAEADQGGKAEAFAVRGANSLTLRSLVALIEDVAGRSVPVDWGARPYREREVMTPWLGETLPDWTPRIDLRTGLAALVEVSDDAV